MSIAGYMQMAAVMVALLILGYLILKKKQDRRKNWAMLYAMAWMGVSLYFVDGWCVSQSYWFWGTSDASMPADLYFLWLCTWSLFTVSISRARYPVIIALLMGYIDLLIMPQLAAHSTLTLSPDWWRGELIVLVLVLIPGLYWARAYLRNEWLAFRAAMQVLTFGILIVFALPSFVIASQSLPTDSVQVKLDWIYLLFVLIPWTIPGLQGAFQLVKQGWGTPFPYDPTQRLVRTGVYAYLKNPIQLSSTLVFIPMAVYLDSWIYLIAVLASILYSIGLARAVEVKDMKDSFGEPYIRYNSLVPSWLPAWRPADIPQAQIFFKRDCSYCQSMRRWCEGLNPTNIKFLHAEDFESGTLTEVTYLREDGTRYGSIRALSHYFSHVNLIWSIIGWTLRWPLIVHLLQLVVDSLDLGNDEEASCAIEERE